MTKISIITSKECIASMNMRECLFETKLFEKTNTAVDGNPVFVFKESKHVHLYLISERMIHYENPEKQIDADLFIFLCKHRAKSGIPSVTVHVTGNFGKAEFGGKDNTLCTAPALWMHKAYRSLEEEAKDSRYGAIMEATHHGPYSDKPMMFMELGSMESEWVDKLGGRIVAKALLRLLQEGPSKNIPAAVGIGGLHHVPNLIKFVKNDKLALGHVVAKHVVPTLTLDTIRQAMDKTYPKAELVILDWKGLGEEKARIKQLLEGSDVKWVRSDQL